MIMSDDDDDDKDWRASAGKRQRVGHKESGPRSE